MNGDFAAKFFWVCQFLFVYSLVGEISLFQIVNTNLTIRDEKIRHGCQTYQNTTTFQSLLYQQIHFNQIKSTMAAYNMSNVHVSPDVLSTLLLFQQGNLYKLQQKIMYGISRSSRPEVICKKKLLLKLHRIHRKIPVSESLFNNVVGLQICNFTKKRLQVFSCDFATFLRTSILKNI